jgi:hypothetical protein
MSVTSQLTFSSPKRLNLLKFERSWNWERPVNTLRGGVNKEPSYAKSWFMHMRCGSARNLTSKSSERSMRQTGTPIPKQLTKFRLAYPA